MASAITSLLLSPLSATTNRELSSSASSSTKLLYTEKTRKTVVRRCGFKSPVAVDRIPKQFREENLKDGLMENYKNAPEFLYGLAPGQLDMFMNEDNPFSRQAGKVTKESLTSGYHYLKHGGMGSLSATGRGPSPSSMSGSMMRGGGARRRRNPPDLPSILLDNRIVYLGLPLVPEVSELIVSQFIWLDYVGEKKPIYLYINSSGTQNENKEYLADDSEAYAIADSMLLSRADIYTINTGIAFGQSAMLLSLGKKGKRAVLPASYTKLYLPRTYVSSGPVSDMWIKARELDTMTTNFLKLLSRGTGKSQEELEKDLAHDKAFSPQQAIDYGIVDKIMYSLDNNSFAKRDRQLSMQAKVQSRQASQEVAAGQR